MKNNIYTDKFGNQLFNGNTEKIIKKEQDNSYDLILSDPPYNINYNNNRRIKTRKKIYGIDGILNDKDNLKIIENIYNHYFRILKEGKHIYIFTRWDVAQDHIDLLRKSGFVIKNNLIWMKNSWSMGDLYGNYAGQYENIIFGYKPYSTGKNKGKGEKLNNIGNTQRHSNILQYDRVVGNKQIHSHQKPIDLLQFLIKKSTNVGDKIYDGFIGSNSLGLSAISLFRKYSGNELEKDIFNKSIKLTEQLSNTLFDFISNEKSEYIYIPELYIFLINKNYELKNDIILKNGKNKISVTKNSIKGLLQNGFEYNGYFVLTIK